MFEPPIVIGDGIRRRQPRFSHAAILHIRAASQ
jgi:hypothetical protein